MNRFNALLLAAPLLPALAHAQTAQPGDLVLAYPNMPTSSVVARGIDGTAHLTITGNQYAWISAARFEDGRMVVHNNSGATSLEMFSDTGAYLTQYTISPANYASDIDVFSDNVIAVCSRGQGILLYNDLGHPLGALNPTGMLSANGCKIVADDTIWVADFATFPGNTDGRIWHLDRQGNVLHAFDTAFDPADVDLGPDGTVWVAGYDGLIARFDVNGTLLGQFTPQIDSALKSLWSLAVGDDGVIWASGHYDSKVRGYDELGNVVYVYDTFTEGNSTFSFVMPGLSWVRDHCTGDGSGNVCPCGNLAGATEGCANSLGIGAHLEVLGTNSVPADGLRLFAGDMPAFKPALALVGDQLQGAGYGQPMGDGLSCVSGVVQSLGVAWTDAAGEAHWGPGLGAAGGWSPGDTRVFQIVYRDPGSSPCASGFNLTNSVEVDFQP